MIVFCEALNIANLLKAQLQQSIEKMYPTDLINQNTNKITKSITECFTHLFKQYGAMNYQKVEQLEDKIRNFKWDLNDSPEIFTISLKTS